MRLQLLGRGSTSNVFVKNGTTKGFTEIELYNPDGDNWIINREVTAEANASTWKLNGAPLDRLEKPDALEMRIRGRGEGGNAQREDL